MEEPLLTLHLQASYRDYKNVISSPLHQIGRMRKIRLVSYLLLCTDIFAVVLTWIFHIGIKGYPMLKIDIFSAVLLTTIEIFAACVLCLRICGNMHASTAWLMQLYLHIIPNSYRGKSKKDSKNIIVPYCICFYDTYLTKSCPCVVQCRQTSAKQIKNLPLSYTGTLRYSQIPQVLTTKGYIIFAGEKCFIPKCQLNAEQIKSLNVIISKIKQVDKDYIY